MERPDNCLAFFIIGNFIYRGIYWLILIYFFFGKVRFCLEPSSYLLHLLWIKHVLIQIRQSQVLLQMLISFMTDEI